MQIFVCDSTGEGTELLQKTCLAGDCMCSPMQSTIHVVLLKSISTVFYLIFVKARDLMCIMFYSSHDTHVVAFWMSTYLLLLLMSTGV